jgi:effector-binding domain-containing protein
MNRTQSLQPVEVQVEPVFAVQMDGECGSDPAEIAETMGSAFGRIHDFVGRRHLHLTGPPRAIYTEYSGGRAKFTVAIPVSPPAGEVASQGGVKVAKLAGGKALRFGHKGPYRDLRNTYGAITQWMKDEGRLQSDADWVKYMPMWEEYMNDPQSTPEADLLTYIYIPEE